MNTYIWFPRVLCRLGVSLALIAGWPMPTAAWTDTKLTSASARVDARSAGRVQVELELGVRVNAGWLSHFELLDLGADFELDAAHPVQFVDASGKRFTPSVRTTDQHGVVLEFARTQAPKTGAYTLLLAWRSRAPLAGDDGRATWALPRWPNRIPDVRIDVLTPHGSEALTSDTQGADRVSASDLPAEHTTWLRFGRTELPRADAFSVSWQTPRARSQHHTQLALARALEQPPVSMFAGLCAALACVFSALVR
ncbi:MAG: hypothetical protein RL701_164, partial [Pseudomonadota bacterium]